MFLILTVLLLAIYFYGTRTYKYWEIRNIKHDKPIFLFGTNLKNYLLQRNITQQAESVYWRYPNERVVGFYRGWRPELLIRDPDIVRRILKSDFSYFHKRGLNQHENVEPLLRNLFFVDGDLWKLLRQRTTPAFTTGKLKSMFPLVADCVKKMRERISSTAVDDTTVTDAHELMARFTTDVICASGFNIDAGALKNDDALFRKLGKKIFLPDYRDIAVYTLKDILPELTNKLLTFNSEIEHNFFSLIRNVLKLKSEGFNDTKRKDFIDLLLEYKSKGAMVGPSLEKFKQDGSPEVISEAMNEELMAAQAFIYFSAGYQTSATVTSFILHQLAHNPTVQQTAQEEIDNVLLKYNNTLTYDGVKEMSYLLNILKEGLRMFPPIGFISRKCTRPYTFKDLNLTIDKEVTVIIPVKALHNDPMYFEDPEEFRPERFFIKNRKPNSKRIFIPFGDGPRTCVGNRMAMIQSLSGLAAVLSQFTVEPAPNTKRNPELNPASNLVQIFKDGLPLLFKKRKNISILQ